MNQDKQTNKSIFGYVRILLIAASLFMAFAVVLLLITQQVKSYNKTTAKIKEERLSAAKKFVENIVSIESEYIVKIKKEIDDEMIKRLETNVNEGLNLAETIYKTNRSKLSDEQIKRLIKNAMGSLRSSQTRQLVLINDTLGRGVLNPNNPQLEGTDLLEMKDNTGRFFIKDDLKTIKDQNEGYRYTLDSIAGEVKVVFVKRSAIYGWYFASALYPSNYSNELRRELSSRVAIKTFNYKGGSFIYEKNGRAVSALGKAYHGNDVFNLSNSTDKYVINLFEQLKSVKSENGEFIEYPWYKDFADLGNANALSEKTSFVRYEPSSGWYIGAGFFEAEIDKELADEVNDLRRNLWMRIFQIILLFVFIVLVEIGLLNWFEKRFNGDFTSFVSYFKKGGEELNAIPLENLNFKEFNDLGLVANEMISARQVVEKRLLSEQEKAREADLLKSSFLANMSHEIRTPMNAIIGFSNFLSEDLSQEERSEFVALIRSNGDTLLSIIDSIIDFSKIEVGQLALQDNTVSYDKIAHAIQTKYDRFIEETDSKLKFRIDNKLPEGFTSKTDEYRLIQVLKNLIDNAFKFTSEGEIVLTIEKKLDYLHFKVKDTGIGIAPENQLRIFDRFTQIDGNLSRNYGGTGIGLAISAKIIEMLKGKIWVDSVVGEGAEFQFLIPLQKE